MEILWQATPAETRRQNRHAFPAAARTARPRPGIHPAAQPASARRPVRLPAVPRALRAAATPAPARREVRSATTREGIPSPTMGAGTRRRDIPALRPDAPGPRQESLVPRLDGLVLRPDTLARARPATNRAPGTIAGNLRSIINGIETPGMATTTTSTMIGITAIGAAGAPIRQAGRVAADGMESGGTETDRPIRARMPAARSTPRSTPMAT